MAGSNPFSPFAQDGKPLGAPQLPGVQAPNVAMQDTPSFVETVAPTIFTEAMGSEAAGKAGNYMLDGAKNAFSAFTTPSTIGSAISPSAMLGGGAEGAIAAQQAAAAGTAAAGETALMGANLAAGGAEAAIAAQAAAAASQAAAAGTALTGAATAGAEVAAAGAAPLALMAGPFAPLIIGGAMLAAGK